MKKYVNNLVKKAKENSYRLANLSALVKSRCLMFMAEALEKNKDFILAENNKDISSARKLRLNNSFIDRLSLNGNRLVEMASCLKKIASLDEVTGQVITGWRRPNGIFINKVRVPIGVILIIYEARPNVTSDCIGLCFKSSNIVILKGGRRALNSNRAIFKVLQAAVSQAGVDFSPFFFIEKTAHQIVDLFLKQSSCIDLVIPRGGESLVKKVTDNSSIPVIKHYKGVCHIFVDKFADFKKALSICVNAKTQRPAVCNAVETILVHKAVAKNFLPHLKKEFDKYNVKMKGDNLTRKILKNISAATVDDWYAEYLDLIRSEEHTSELQSH